MHDSPVKPDQSKIREGVRSCAGKPLGVTQGSNP